MGRSEVPGELTRRRALGLLAGAATAGVAAACSSSAPSRRAATPRPSVTRTTTTPHPPRPADWRALARKVHGDVLRPSTPGYDEARLLFDRRFDGIRPQAVLRAAADTDVSQAVDFATSHGIGLRVRSGGHSYLGASAGPGLVVDLRELGSVDVGSGSATIGGGAALVDVYSALAAHGASIPAGSCPSVGLSGLTLGGGVGVVARQYGLTCDRLLAATVVLADGSVVHCSPTRHSDLFWALRGGGGSFGAVTSMQLETHPTSSLAHGFVSWPWSAAAQVLAAWQAWMAGAPRALWSTCHLLATNDGSGPTVSVATVYVGSVAGLSRLTGELTDRIPTRASSTSVSGATYEQTMMLEAGCSTLSVAACHVAAETPGGTLPRDAFVAGSDYFRHPIPRTGIARIVAAVQARQSAGLGVGGVAFDSLAGAVDDPEPAATAYIHRGALFSAQYTASWGQVPGNGPLPRNRRSLAALHDALRPYASGEAYQNYADATLRSPQQAYYGSNLTRLVAVRRRYDPHGVFTQPQGVPLQLPT